MRRQELLKAIDLVQTALVTSLVQQELEEAVSRPEIKPENLTELLKALKHYTIEASNFPSGAGEVAQILGLDLLENPETWAQLSGKPVGTRIAYELYQRVRFATEYLPRFTHLIQQDQVLAFTELTPASREVLGKSLLSVILIEDRARLSSPERIIETIQSVDQLFKACCIIVDMPSEKLSVIACDSGSDKSFDFLGAAKVIECVKDIILSLWDRIVFFREKQLSQRIELVAQALPVVEQIGNLERDKKIGPEQAELLRRNILEGTTKFIESGAIIPEIQDRSQFNPRILMAPAPKLLVSAPEEVLLNSNTETRDSVKRAIGSNPTIEGLSEYEQTELLRLLQKTRQEERPNHEVGPSGEDHEDDDGVENNDEASIEGS
jgi:hypothetical protein